MKIWKNIIPLCMGCKIIRKDGRVIRVHRGDKPCAHERKAS